MPSAWASWPLGSAAESQEADRPLNATTECSAGCHTGPFDAGRGDVAVVLDAVASGLDDKTTRPKHGTKQLAKTSFR
jgi:hypothetical protein